MQKKKVSYVEAGFYAFLALGVLYAGAVVYGWHLDNKASEAAIERAQAKLDQLAVDLCRKQEAADEAAKAQGAEGENSLTGQVTARWDCSKVDTSKNPMDEYS